MSVIDLTPFNTILARLETVAGRLERGGGASGYPPSAAAAAPAAPVAAAAPEDPAIAVAFDVFVLQQLPFLEAAAKAVGAQDVLDATQTFAAVLPMIRELLVASGSCRKPADTEWAKLLAPVLELGKAAQKGCDNRSEFFHHKKAAAEALNVAMIVSMPSPPSHVQGVLETVDFHAVKVMLKKVPAETAWAKAFKDLFKDLKEWCVEHCKLGLIWKAGGEDPVAHAAARAGAEPAAGKGKGKGPAVPKGGLAPPPPELVAQMRTGTGAASAPSGGGGMGAIFGAIGGFDTSALKKVTSDMKTKNQAREAAPVPAPVAKAAAAAPARGRDYKGPKGPPSKELQKDTNWVIENFENVPDMTLDDIEKQQLVLIVNCRNVTVRINSKVKSITIDSCERVNLICEDVISAVELVNSERCKVQTIGLVHSFAIDKCNGVNIFLGKKSLQAEFVTAKSSEMNVTIPDENGDEGDIIELPIPEQFVTTLVGRKLKTEVSGLYSG